MRLGGGAEGEAVGEEEAEEFAAGDGIVEGVVGRQGGCQGGDCWHETQGWREIFKGVRGAAGKNGAGEREGVNPGAEAVEGRGGAEDGALGAGVVGD